MKDEDIKLPRITEVVAEVLRNGDKVYVSLEEAEKYAREAVRRNMPPEHAINPITHDIPPAVYKRVQLCAGILQMVCHGAAAKSGWWNDLATGKDLRLENNVPEKLMLIVSEVAGAMEGHRKGLMDDKLLHRKMIEVELADAVTNIFDLAGAKGYDVAGAIAEKLAYNAQRADHKPENRFKEGGKAY